MGQRRSTEDACPIMAEAELGQWHFMRGIINKAVTRHGGPEKWDVSDNERERR